MFYEQIIRNLFEINKEIIARLTRKSSITKYNIYCIQLNNLFVFENLRLIVLYCNSSKVYFRLIFDLNHCKYSQELQLLITKQPC